MDTITKQNIDEIRTLSAPPQLVKDALGAIFLLLGYSSAQATVSTIKSRNDDKGIKSYEKLI